ncbi:MAG: hypothetical protein RIR70_528 [Pseudomonadota bacterium]|jgi:flagellar assembly protein FliH
MVQPWNPPLFDDQGELRLPTAGELDLMRSDVQKNAHDHGREAGFAKGMAEGYAAGFDQGREEGRQAALAEARGEIAKLTTALQAACAVLADLPQVVGPDLTELAFQIGQRLSGRESLERGPFMAAVQEALMRLPRPGETLFVRLSPDEVTLWQGVLQDASLPLNCQIQLDPSVPPGHAFVEVDGARINVGALARGALLRMALDLPLAPNQPEIG